MADPYIKSIPNGADGTLHFVMDKAGFELFERLLSRANPAPADSPANFAAVKDRIVGAFILGAIQMGWESKHRGKPK
ncbi:hypothetical protein PXK01_19670 [Phaeobacter sp. PT47_59]|uniref:hypothetical protein n=1 Tax=Phaeobacter sp. PT47_59 TaxID=3029979 RepID=UPI0023802455|nr:hypothetical protein [Phaeobacter sp. PT47_59]MDE4176381.1 hypothetical protein [Phaeobacter sp. PT47_59]